MLTRTQRDLVTNDRGETFHGDEPVWEPLEFIWTRRDSDAEYGDHPWFDAESVALAKEYRSKKHEYSSLSFLTALSYKHGPKFRAIENACGQVMNRLEQIEEDWARRFNSREVLSKWVSRT